MMIYLVRTAHWQFLALVLGCVAWILTLATAGLNEWRLWSVPDQPMITSGVAWVGIWRACFSSHAYSKPENCWTIHISDQFLPPEIPVAQVLMMLAVICGLAGNVCGSMSVRMAYFSVEDRRNIRLVFVLAGGLYILTGTLTLVPVVWNLNSVLTNRTIDFPPEFCLPKAPAHQQVGSAIGVGLLASILMLCCGLTFLCYKHVWVDLKPQQRRGMMGLDNPTFIEEPTRTTVISREGPTEI
ncbi:claudin-34 [Synchiropus splendidus]|uniref:claudin-34 n=1 Tax=Synchiropus splendidus TaxID=270530 RepID=UPI00237E97B8|nr:claudin-34 [Synchiropus splendidus]